jgi:arylsulfatase A-like enzyme
MKGLPKMMKLKSPAAGIFLAAVATAAGTQERPPNVIVILTDDLAYGDAGCYGALPEHFTTPNLDRMAREGVRFTDAHSPGSVCAPSRYALLTGEYAFRGRTPGHRHIILRGDAALSIPPGTYTLPEMFKQHGYTTGLVGKWHLGLAGGGDDIHWNGEIKPGPLEVGFDTAFYIPSTGDRVPTVLVRDHRVINLDPADPIRVSYKEKIGDEPTGAENPEKATVLLGNPRGHDKTITMGVSRMGWMSGGKAALWKDDELTDRLTDEVVGFIRENREKPFFLYFAPHGIHEPRITAQRFAGQSGAGVYGDMVVEMDDVIGRILHALDELELAGETLLVVSSDNGGSPNDLRSYQYGERANLNGHRPNGVLRGQKYSLWEGGTPVPLLVRWPGRARAGTVSPALISLMDLHASFARLIGAEPPEGAARDSEELLDVLLGITTQGREEWVVQSQGPLVALRQGDWKWVEGQLFDLSVDLAEKNDLTGEFPERARQMAVRLEELKDELFPPWIRRKK